VLLLLVGCLALALIASVVLSRIDFRPRDEREI
jgi:hypothetical protein